MIEVLGGMGFVRLDGSMADDLSVVNGARVSFAKRVEEMSDGDAGLINFLMRERHGTPFEHNAFRFHVKCPIFIAREWMRHRIGSFNEMSGRYTKLEGEFYLPEKKNIRSQVGKPGSYRFEPVENDVARYAQNRMKDSYVEAWSTYEGLLEDGVAKEVARMVLPVGIFTQFYWTLNARSLMNFISLRTAQVAMLEIREYASAVETLFAEKMPITHSAFVSNGRMAP